MFFVRVCVYHYLPCLQSEIVVSNMKTLTTSLQTICEKCGQCSDAASREHQRAAQVLQRYVSSKDHANDDAQAV